MQIFNFILPFSACFTRRITVRMLLVQNDKSYGLYSSPTKLLKCSSAFIAPVLS